MFDNNAEEIEKYKEEMIQWIVENSDSTYKEVKKKFEEEKSRVDVIFKAKPEIVKTQKPAKWGKIYGFNFGFIDEYEITFAQ